MPIKDKNRFYKNLNKYKQQRNFCVSLSRKTKIVLAEGQESALPFWIISINHSFTEKKFLIIKAVRGYIIIKEPKSFEKREL